LAAPLRQLFHKAQAMKQMTISGANISRAADLLNAKTPTGSIDIYTAAYPGSVSEYLKRRDAPTPERKPMQK
jgi:hypothetical protein